jgi:hypothetical protein
MTVANSGPQEHLIAKKLWRNPNPIKTSKMELIVIEISVIVTLFCSYFYKWFLERVPLKGFQYEDAENSPF